MGMDIYGKSPSSPKGEYFRNNVWWWRPLADYCLEVSPATTALCSGWHTNDGDGLDEKGCLELAADLRACLLSGMTLEHERRRAARLSGMPLEECDLCHGTGAPTGSQMHTEESQAREESRYEDANQARPYYQPLAESLPHSEKCSGCNGYGSRESSESWYAFSEDNVREWVEFLESCGGFRIC